MRCDGPRARKVRSVPCFPFPRKKHGRPQHDFRPLYSRMARCLSVNRSCHKLLTRTTTCPGHRPAGHRNRTQNNPSIYRAENALFMRHQHIFRRATQPQTHTHLKPKSQSNRLAHNLHKAAPRWTPPNSLCTSSKQENCLATCRLDQPDLARQL